MTEKTALRQANAMYFVITMMISLATAKGYGIGLFIIPISIHFFLLLKMEMDCLGYERKRTAIKSVLASKKIGG